MPKLTVDGTEIEVRAVRLCCRFAGKENLDD
jgi:hypothetical protein